MNESSSGYKIIAAVSLTAALFSCGTPGNTSVSNQEVLDKLNDIEAQMSDLQLAESEKCSTEAFLSDECATNQLPDGASAYTTFCISQGSGVELGAEYAVGLDYGIELGPGWAEVADVKFTGNMTTPAIVGIPPALWGFSPTGISAGGSFGIGRGMDTCVDVPIELSAAQADRLLATISAANEDGAKYERRVGRVLDYADTRTNSGLALKSQSTGYSKFQPRWNEDDAFDIAESAVDRFLSGSFTQIPSKEFGSNVFGDPIFLDLASSLDLPKQMLDLIEDPLNPMQGIAPLSNLSSACADGGITTDVRNRFAGIDNLCTNLEGLPSFGSIKKAFNRVPSLPTASQVKAEVKTVICNNSTLSVLSNCP